MESELARWLDELGIENPFNNGCQMSSNDDSLADFTTMEDAHLFKQDFIDLPLSPIIRNSSHQPNLDMGRNTTHGSTLAYSTETYSHDRVERPKKQLKINSHGAYPSASSSSPSPYSMISFGNPNLIETTKPQSSYEEYYGVMPTHESNDNGNMNLQAMSSQEYCYDTLSFAPKEDAKRVKIRPLAHAQDHLMAERNRREKLNQRIIQLSSIIPGLKKTDKASILEDAVKYLKELQERVQKLEELMAKRTIESVIITPEIKPSTDDGTKSSNYCMKDQLSEIEVRILNEEVLLRVHCNNQNGITRKIVNEIEKLHLLVVNSNVIPFGSTTLYITLIAQMGEKFSMTAKDLAENLRQACLDFMRT